MTLKHIYIPGNGNENSMLVPMQADGGGSINVGNALGALALAATIAVGGAVVDRTLIRSQSVQTNPGKCNLALPEEEAMGKTKPTDLEL